MGGSGSIQHAASFGWFGAQTALRQARGFVRFSHSRPPGPLLKGTFSLGAFFISWRDVQEMGKKSLTEPAEVSRFLYSTPAGPLPNGTLSYGGYFILSPRTSSVWGAP